MKTKYTLQELIDKKIAIRCNSQEEADKVCKFMNIERILIPSCCYSIIIKPEPKEMKEIIPASEFFMEDDVEEVKDIIVDNFKLQLTVKELKSGDKISVVSVDGARYAAVVKIIMDDRLVYDDFSWTYINAIKEITRSVDMSKYIGKLGWFWDYENNKNVLGILYKINDRNIERYNSKNGFSFQNFTPLTQSEIDELNPNKDN